MKWIQYNNEIVSIMGGALQSHRTYLEFKYPVTFYTDTQLYLFFGSLKIL